MKRDMDLIRKLLLEVEAAPTGFAPRSLAVDGYTADQIDYHSYLLVQGGYAEGPETTTLVFRQA